MGEETATTQQVRLAQLTFVVRGCAIDKGMVLLKDFITDSERRRVARQVFYKINVYTEGCRRPEKMSYGSKEDTFLAQVI